MFSAAASEVTTIFLPRSLMAPSRVSRFLKLRIVCFASMHHSTSEWMGLQDALAFLDAFPMVKGHALLIPKRKDTARAHAVFFDSSIGRLDLVSVFISMALGSSVTRRSVQGFTSLESMPACSVSCMQYVALQHFVRPIP